MKKKTSMKRNGATTTKTNLKKKRRPSAANFFIRLKTLRDRPGLFCVFFCCRCGAIGSCATAPFGTRHPLHTTSTSGTLICQQRCVSLARLGFYIGPHLDKQWSGRANGNTPFQRNVSIERPISCRRIGFT